MARRTPPYTMARMGLVRRILKALIAALAFGVYVWVAGVRNSAALKRRKAASRVSRESLTGS